MGRIVEVLVGVSALAGIATFLGFRAAFRKTVATLTRHPEISEDEEHPQGYEEEEDKQ